MTIGPAQEICVQEVQEKIMETTENNYLLSLQTFMHNKTLSTNDTIYEVWEILWDAMEDLDDDFINEFLEKLDPTDMLIDIAIAPLTATYRISDRLPGWKMYFDKLKAYLKSIGKEWSTGYFTFLEE